MDPYHCPLIAGNFYHLFNRAVGNEKLFHTDENYKYFLAKLKHHVLPVADLYRSRFCLITFIWLSV